MTAGAINGGSHMPKYYLAIDIGASSGRHIVGWTEDGELKTEEVYRFPNGIFTIIQQSVIFKLSKTGK